MNGAAMNCRQDQVLHSQHRDSRGLRDARYHLQMNHPCEQNFLPHHSKAINSQSDNFLVDGSAEYLQCLHTIDTTLTASEYTIDPRSQVRWTQMRQPIDLPVPKFEKDENCVANHPATDNLSHDKLDLDTRIDLLIKSKALAGMHPIFSELVESEDESDDSLLRCPKKIHKNKNHKSFSPVETIVYDDKDDDPDKPLSRPPSPFLSRATYLFWFNKAIELKEQAKAQEQALLEKATKKLQDNITSVKPNHVEKSDRENKSFFNCLLNEISKEMKEMIKQQFINEVLESTISNSLENWWGTEFVQQEQQKLVVGHNKSITTSIEQNKNTSDDILICGSSEKIVSGWKKTTSIDNVSSEHEVFEHKEKLFNEDNNSFNETNNKEQHSLRCGSTLIHPDKSNTASIDRNVSKESFSTINSIRTHTNIKSENKHEKLMSDKMQDEINFQDSLKVNIEHIKPGSPVPTHITLNTSLSQDQEDNVVSLASSGLVKNLETADKSDSTDGNRQNFDETHPSKTTNDKSSEHESSSSVIENSVIIDKECLNITTSERNHDKRYLIGNHDSYSTKCDIAHTVIDLILCQDIKNETILTDTEVEVQEYPKNSVLNEEDANITKQSFEESMESATSSHVHVEEKGINNITITNVDQICDKSKDLN